MRGIGPSKKLHVVSEQYPYVFLCGAEYYSEIDENDPNYIDFSKGVCKNCSKIYKGDLTFEVIKLKLGIKL